jgi:hypothetical protein
MYLSHFNLKEKPFTGSGISNISDSVNLTEKETGIYIRKQLRGAQNEKQIFSASAIRKIFLYSEGHIPFINKMCDLSLWKAFDKKNTYIKSNDVKEAVEEYLESNKYILLHRNPNGQRRHTRIVTNFSGDFFHKNSNSRGMIQITNLSYSGLQFKKSGRKQTFRCGDRVVISFNLDDENKTGISETMIIKYVSGDYAGAAFNMSPDSKAFRNYLKHRISDITEFDL